MGFIPSKLLGKKLNNFFNNNTRYPAINPASKAPKKPALTTFIELSLKYCSVTPD